MGTERMDPRSMPRRQGRNQTPEEEVKGIQSYERLSAGRTYRWAAFGAISFLRAFPFPGNALTIFKKMSRPGQLNRSHRRRDRGIH